MNYEKEILVVEDEPHILSMVVELLTDEGYILTGIGKAREALELANRKNFNLIILDMKLPDMTGNEFLQNMHQPPPLSPVIVFSANIRNLEPHPQVKASIAKPFDIEELLDLVSQNIR